MTIKETQDSPFMMIPIITAAVFAIVALLCAMGGIASVTLIQEGISAFLGAIMASIISLFIGAIACLIIIVTSIYTNVHKTRIYNLLLGSVFVVLLLFTNSLPYFWFFFDPGTRAEYYEYKSGFENGVGRLLDDQFDFATVNNSPKPKGYMEWRAGFDYGYEYYSVYGDKDNVPFSIAVSSYDYGYDYGDDNAGWEVTVTPLASIPSADLQLLHITDVRVVNGNSQYLDLNTSKWTYFSELDPYFATASRSAALAKLIEMSDGYGMNIYNGEISLGYSIGKDETGTNKEHKKLASVLVLIAELYPSGYDCGDIDDCYTSS